MVGVWEVYGLNRAKTKAGRSMATRKIRGLGGGLFSDSRPHFYWCNRILSIVGLRLAGDQQYIPAVPKHL